MKVLSVISLLLIAVGSAHAALNGPCSVGGTPGVCIKTSSCSSAGGTSHTGYCPKDPVDVKCCTKTSCGNGGNCRWTSQCSGTTVSNKCPGPANFKCCEGKGSTPTIPTNKCKPHVVASGKKILAQFPGAIHTVWCYANKPGDHGLGLALDLMVGARNPIGRTIAEWVMNNHSSLKVKYVIWGQKIWDVRSDKNPKPWTSWKQMEDRGSITANHWDHPHVSFFP
ncbi:hypothetical protein EV426DRAFT_415498 [Tirmania nivea]|nr:hypothetical protein EV426DRAFT_415498 [Tirmania nivea]